MLRDVYQQNLRLGEPASRRRAVRRPPTRILVLCALLVVAAWGQVYPVSEQLAARRTSASASGVSEAATAATMPPPAPIVAMAVPGRVSADVPDERGGASSAPSPSPGEVPSAHASDLSAYAAAAARKEVNVRKLFGLSVRTIVIDAGHGGHDAGTTGRLGMREKDVTLDVSRRLRDKLQEAGGYRILLVRDDDVFVALKDRVAFANAYDTDLFVSVHVNYLPYTSTNAIETYYFSTKYDRRTAVLADTENRDSGYQVSEFESMLRGMEDTIKLQESKTLAHSIQRALLDNVRRSDRKVLDIGVRTAPFVVLLGVKAPSVLAEIASLSSEEAERDLRSERYRDEIAAYLAAGITGYLQRPPEESERKHGKDESRFAHRR